MGRELKTEDSPGTKYLVDDDTRTTRTDSFKTYLMYKAYGDSIWVSLRLLEWGWNGEAENTADGWQLVSGSTYGDGEATDVLPEWKKNVNVIQQEMPSREESASQG